MAPDLSGMLPTVLPTVLPGALPAALPAALPGTARRDHRTRLPVAGWMVWRLLDNVAWASGCAKRFGIVHVDYAPQRRTLMHSARWYQGFLRRQRAASPHWPVAAAEG